jgi:DNA-binding CsgD family transcriptional regulator
MGAGHSAAIAEFRHLCALGLPSHEVVPQLLRHLHELIPSATNLFDWVDADGRIVDYYTEPPYLPEVARRYFDDFYNAREGEALPPYSAHVRAASGVRRAPRSPRFYESEFYRQIWRPRGVHHCIEAVVRDGERPLGSVALYRRADEAEFSAAEVASLQALLPYFARALKGAGDYCGARALAAPPALVMASAGGAIRYASAEGRLRLALALHPCLNRRACGAACSGADEEIAAQIASLAAELRLRPASGASLHRTNRWGRFSLNAQWLESDSPAGEPLIGITVAHEVPLPLAIGAALVRLPLSPRQRELCLLLAQGSTYAEIGARMGISEQTAISYARVACQKLGVHGREDLLRCLLLPAGDGAARPAAPMQG